MRGNPFTLDQVLSRCAADGSIPAHAGEPPVRLSQLLSQGLSPRMRGNPYSLKARCRCGGVYPRACGGTVDTAYLRSMSETAGSIPAHAGEPAPGWPRSQRRPGSIPAHAGEPHGVTGGGTALGSIPAHAGEPLVANLLILVVFKEQGDEGHPLISLQEQNAVRIDNLFRRLAEGFDSQVS